MYKNSGSCIHLLATPGLPYVSAQCLFPCSIGFIYLVALGFLVIVQSERSKYGAQGSEVAVSSENRLLPECHFLPCLHSFGDRNQGK